MKRKRENQRPDAAVTPQVKSQKATKTKKTRAERRAERHRLLPVHRRPIVCPPDRAGRKLPFRLDRKSVV